MSKTLNTNLKFIGTCCGWLIIVYGIGRGVESMSFANEIDAKRSEFEKITYPYEANKQRSERIKCNSSKVKLGMGQEEVVKLLGQPDLISPVYNTIKNGTITGSFYFYLLRQDKKSGSRNEVNQQSIAVCFDLDGKVERVIGENTPFHKDIGTK
ncbi:outer membrane protein assembly factor BamE domain-containing protein [Oligosphaera ethanolica]|uniref:Outer membrane protein assembly factor BamE (Lipoprotein component of BamABCDE complex) n=1 Tax=Oligosphaera ethanolica TaxID=760260 RepID=A0AAE3VJY3_9BACT|nr:outer membrane protein assembly factor BamE [Oligosphaera ethanolica]MDQ0291828.1 outer membrane protein assembly factor BamE (lipoprotein component of BamABCDE complex) [Oligosphaera ethanolica]